MLSFLICLFGSLASVTQASVAVPFFRTMDAPLPSGEASLEELIQRRIHGVTDDVQLVEKDGRRLYLSRDHFWRAADFAKDEGAVLTPTRLRREPSWKSESISGQSELAARAHFQVMTYGPDFLEVSSRGLRGFLPIESVVLQADFAKKFSARGGVFEFHHRERDHLVSADGKSFDLDQVSAIETDLTRGIMNAEEIFAPRTRIQITHPLLAREVYQKSFLPTHGSVYWHLPAKEDPLETSTSGARSPTSETTADATLAKPPPEAPFFASCPGENAFRVYSRDGAFIASRSPDFRVLPNFKGRTLPVALAECDKKIPLIFIGNEVSSDGGYSFHSFIEWTALFQTVNQTVKEGGSELRIAEIRPLKNSEIQYTLFTGKHLLKLSTSAKITPALQWKLVSWRPALDSSGF